MSFEIIIDASSPFRLAEFWAAALPDYQIRPYDDDEIARLAAIGLTPETDTSVPIDAAGQPTIWFQKCERSNTDRNRIHFDLKHAERASEAARLRTLGASILIERKDHIVMLDPEGNQFCLFDP